MNIEQLYLSLQELGVPPDQYYIQGLYGSTNDGDKLALIIKKGKTSIEFEVYFKEKGERTFSKIFTKEEDACRYFYNLVINEKKRND